MNKVAQVCASDSHIVQDFFVASKGICTPLEINTQHTCPGYVCNLLLNTFIGKVILAQTSFIRGLQMKQYEITLNYIGYSP